MHEYFPGSLLLLAAQVMLNTARIMDPTGESMELAVKNFFHWGVLFNNRSGLARAQYAMVFQCVKQKYDNAERYYKQVRKWCLRASRVSNGSAVLFLTGCWFSAIRAKDYC